MVADLNFNIEVVVAPTLREVDGLALSSRNRYLTTTQRVEALVLSRALRKATDMVAAGERRVDRLIAEATHLIGQQRRVRIIYVSIVNRLTMEAIKGEITLGTAVMTIAVWVDEVRLIDNEIL